jgi:hypothetical protein
LHYDNVPDIEKQKTTKSNITTDTEGFSSISTQYRMSRDWQGASFWDVLNVVVPEIIYDIDADI